MNRFYGLKFAQMQGTPGIAPGTEPVSAVTVPKDKRVPTTEAAPAPASIMPPAPVRQHQPVEAKFAEGFDSVCKAAGVAVPEILKAALARETPRPAVSPQLLAFMALPILGKQAQMFTERPLPQWIQDESRPKPNAWPTSGLPPLKPSGPPIPSYNGPAEVAPGTEVPTHTPASSPAPAPVPKYVAPHEMRAGTIQSGNVNLNPKPLGTSPVGSIQSGNVLNAKAPGVTPGTSPVGSIQSGNVLAPTGTPPAPAATSAVKPVAGNAFKRMAGRVAASPVGQMAGRVAASPAGRVVGGVGKAMGSGAGAAATLLAGPVAGAIGGFSGAGKGHGMQEAWNGFRTGDNMVRPLMEGAGKLVGGIRGPSQTTVDESVSAGNRAKAMNHKPGVQAALPKPAASTPATAAATQPDAAAAARESELAAANAAGAGTLGGKYAPTSKAAPVTPAATQQAQAPATRRTGVWLGGKPIDVAAGNPAAMTQSFTPAIQAYKADPANKGAVQAAAAKSDQIAAQQAARGPKGRPGTAYGPNVA